MSEPTQEQLDAFILRAGYRWGWERLAYMGVRRYPGDRRTWYQFEKVDEPGVVWCEVLASDLEHFEETDAASGEGKSHG